MPLVYVVIILLLVGFLLWLANTYWPMDPKIKKIMNVFVIACLLVWLLSLLFPGFFSFVSTVPVPAYRHHR